MEGSAASEEIYRGKVVTLRVETVPEPIGGTQRFEIVEHGDAVAIVAVREGQTASGEPEVALVRQRRPAVGRELWEIPAGVLEAIDGGVPERTASRELAEETGYRATAWRLLTRELTSPGFTTERISIFLATGLHAAPDAQAGRPADPTEITEVRWVALGEALAMCRRHEIEDGKTIAGLFLARDALAAYGVVGGGEMPHDVTNMPMRRDTPFRTDEATTGREGERQFDAGLRLDSMLLEEFNYAGVTAYQCMEDRARMFNLYLLLVGILASGLGAVYQLGDKVATYSQALALGLLLTTGVMGVAFFMKLIRLRQAYRECLIAMNVIKEYYIKHFAARVPDVRDAFRWRLLTVPAGERFGSVTFVVCNTVALLASMCFAAAAIVVTAMAGGARGDLLAMPKGTFPYVLAAAVFLISMLGFTLHFRSALRKKDEQLIIKRQAEQLAIPLPEYLQKLQG